MNGKRKVLSAVAAMVLAGSGLHAGIYGHAGGSANDNGGDVRFGFDRDGGYICIHGFSWAGSGTFQLSFGSASGCGEEDFDFYYKTYGGLIKGTGQVSSLNFKEGEDDVYDDGFWYREGPFSAPVYYGDAENDGRRYADDPNEGWPAWTWGRPEADPFVSADGAGDGLGGAAGIGLGGFGLGDGSKIKADDDAYFYPLTFIGINNFRNSSTGTYASDLSWNVVLYDKDHKEVFKKNYTTTVYYWETINFHYPKYGIICPRVSGEKGEVVNDLAYNKAIHDNIWSRWPDTGLDVDFVSDGKTDAAVCSDAVKLKDQYFSDTFTVRKFPFMPGKKYELVFDGPYVYNAGEGCPDLNEEGLPDTMEKWPASCFEKVDTLWADESGKTRGFMRMTLKEVKEDRDFCHLRPFVPHMKGTIEEKADTMLHRMLDKCGTTREKAVEEIEKTDGCHLPTLGG